MAVEISLGPSRPAVPPLGLGLAPDQAIAPGCIHHGDHPARSIPHLDLSLRLWKPGGSRGAFDEPLEHRVGERS